MAPLTFSCLCGAENRTKRADDRAPSLADRDDMGSDMSHSSRERDAFPNEPQRLPGLRDEEIGAQAREALGGWWPPFNLHRVLAHSPATLAAWIGFGSHILRGNLLDARLRELVILRVGWNARSRYEWGQHAGLSLRLGIPEADILAVADGPDADRWTPLEAAALRGVDQMMAEYAIEPSTYAALAAALSPAQLVDYVMLVGEFILVSLTLNVFQIELDPGLPEMPDRPGSGE
jgi:alkylhydroperoxidase family enzyme